MTAHKFTIGSHNVLYRLADAPQKWAADLDKSAKAHVRGFQEAEGTPARKAILTHLAKVRHSVYMPTHGDPIAWNPAVFSDLIAGKKYEGSFKSLDSARSEGLDTKVNPARYVTWKGLVHKATGKRILFVNVHPTAGATKPEPNEFPERLNDWKDWSIRRFWLDVVRITARELRGDEFALDARGRVVITRKWDAIVLLGDFNAAMDNEREWYYPAAMLDGLYGPDLRTGGLDHIIATHDSDLRIVKRHVLTKGVHTDHALHFADVEI